MGSSSSLGSAGSSSARHLAPGACSEAAPEAPAPGHCCTFADPVTVNLEGAVTFEAPDLPEETLMEVSAPRCGRQFPGPGGGAQPPPQPPHFSAARAHGDSAQPALHAGLRPARAGDRGPEGQRQRHGRGARVPAAGERGGRPDQPAEPGVGVRVPCGAGVAGGGAGVLGLRAA